MAFYGEPDTEYGEPEESTTVNEIQEPGGRHWSWNTNTLVAAALIALFGGFAIYFIVSYTGAKGRALANATTGTD